MNDSELYGWLCAFIGIFVVPMVILALIKSLEPNMPFKRSVSFYLGWIPSNLITCFYLHFSVGVINSLFILFFCQMIQAIFIYFIAKCLIDWFGEQAFP